MTIGRVYVGISESFPGNCKIGFTLRSVPERMAELQRHYRTRHPFTVRFELLVKNPARVEWLAHKRLAAYRKMGTELFECSPEMGRVAVLWAVDRVIEEERRNPSQITPRLERAPKRWRKARRPFPTGLFAILAGAGLLALVAIAKPALPAWLPEPISYTLLLMERLP